MEQTAIQTLITYIQNNEIEYNKKFIFIIFDLLKLEKQQLMEAYEIGHCENFDNKNVDINLESELYYKKMYENI
jgi:hypothetical protein